ncbi:MAG: DPP IV N-terminal domain-containing protein, partial [Pyrinomonadaceae bacterium]
TVPYMSPEQLRGKTVDERSDIFGFGALLFEMITGRQVFGKESNAETIAAILNDTPDLSVIPAALRPTFRRLLEKNVTDRYQEISEVSEDLRCLFQNGIDQETADRQDFRSLTSRRVAAGFRGFFTSSKRSDASLHGWQDSDPSTRTVRITERFGQVTVLSKLPIYQRPLLLGVTLLLIASAVPLLVFWFTRSYSDPHSFDSLRPVQLVSWKVAASGDFFESSSSHNGKMIAYAATKDGSNEGIYIKQIADGGDFRVTGDQWTNYSPIWSPDDQLIAFVSVRQDAYGIYTSPFLGGQTTLLKTLDAGTVTLRQWAKDGTGIYYEFDGNLFRLDLATHDTAQISRFEADAAVDREFSFSPDEKRVVYRDPTGDKTDLWIKPLAGGEPTRLTNDPVEERRPIWHPDGRRILYTVLRDGLYHINVAFLDGREPEQITRGEGEQQLIDLSPDGTEIYYVSWESRSDVWSVNIENGRDGPIVSDKGSEFWPGPSPDGKLLAYQTNSSLNPDDSLFMSSIVIRDLSGNGPPRKTQGFNPRWTPDGRHLAFLRWQDTERRNSLNVIDSVSGEELQIVEQGVGFTGYGTMPYNRSQVSEFSWRPDGKV